MPDERPGLPEERRSPEAAQEGTAPRGRRAWLGTLARFLVSAGLIAAALWLLDWKALRSSLANLTPELFLLAAVTAVPHFLILGLRWHVIVRPLSGAPALSSLADYLVSVFFNSVTPGYIGGDAYRFMSLRRKAPPGRLLATLLRERYVGLVGMIALLVGASALALAEGEVPQTALRPLLSACAFLGLGLLGAHLAEFLIHRRLGGATPQGGLLGRLASFLGVVHEAVNWASPADTLRLCALSMLGALPWLLSVKIIAQAVGAPIGLTGITMVFTLVELARFIPISIQGIGVREGLCAAFFGMLGHSSAEGFVVGAASYLAFQCTLLAMSALGLGLRAWRKGRAKGGA